MRCCSLIEVQAEPIFVESCNNDHTRQPYKTFLKVLEKRKKVSMELDQEGMICVAGTIISLSEYAMKNRCAYGSFGYYRFSTAFRLAIFGSNFSYWFEIVNPIFITTNESLKTVYN